MNAASARKSGLFSRLFDTLVPARARARRADFENRRLQAFLRSVPVEYCGWNKQGLLAISPGFCTILGVEKVSGLQDIQSALTTGDAAALEGLCDRLETYGEHFDIGVSTQDHKRALKIFGKQGADAATGESFTVLWLFDITDLAHAALKSIEMLGAVEKRENELRAILNALPLPVWTRDEALDLVWCNRAYAAAVDDTTAAVIADKKELPVTGTDKGQSPRSIAQRALAGKTPQTGRVHAIIGGARKLMQITEAPVRAGDRHMVGVAQDVTREEELLRDIERQARSNRETLEHLRTAIAAFDADTRLEFYNSAWEQLWGVDGAFLNTQPKLLEFFERLRELRRLPELADYRQFKQSWMAMFTSLLEPREEMLYLPDSTALRLVVVPRPQGGLVLTAEDVTGSLQLETSYNTLIAVQKETIDSLSEGLAVFGEDGRLKLYNPAYARMWDFTPADLEGTPHIARLVERKRKFFTDAEWEERKNAFLATGLERDLRRLRIDRTDGRVLEHSVVPLPDGNILNSWFDVTDKIMADRALAEKQAAMEEAERLKSDFLANVSYQLRTPLNAMVGFADLLNHEYAGKLSDKQREYTAAMIEAGEELTALVNDILDLTTIEAGYLSLNKQSLQVQESIEGVAALTRDWARRMGITLVTDADQASFSADDRRLRQALLNLVRNAIHYTPEGGTITLFAKKDKDAMRIGVRDTGIGIPQKDLARIVLPFERVERNGEKRPGAGLGLALVKSIVELHGGKLEIDSIEGKGTSVTCVFPLA